MQFTEYKNVKVSSVEFQLHSNAWREARSMAENYNRIERRKGKWEASIIRTAKGWKAKIEFWETVS